MAAVAAVIFLAGRGLAGVIASDDASDPAYADGWQGLKGAVSAETGSDNGGTGFQAWNFDDTFWEAENSPYPQPHFIDTKPSSFNNLGAPAFAITNGNVPFNGYTTTAARPFAAGLKVGDEFSFDVDNPRMKPLARGDSVGFIIKLQTTAKAERFGFYTTKDFNGDKWTITDSRGDQTSSGLSDEAGSSGFKFALKLTGDEAYRLTITPKSGDPITVEGSLAKPGKGEIQRLEIAMFGNGSGDGASQATGEREFYFNNLRIESSAAAQTIQKPSDCNQDGSVDISDAVCLLGHLFQGNPASPPCDGGTLGPGSTALLDHNGDAQVDLSDAVSLLNFLFKGGGPPALGNDCQPIAGCPDNSAKCEP